MFDEFMMTTGNNDAASRMAVSIVDYYVEKDKHSTAKKFYDKSESLCEDALEILQEILHYDSSLRVWFDRDISFEVGGDLNADIVSLPRLVTSRSHEKLSDDSRTCWFQHVLRLTVCKC